MKQNVAPINSDVVSLLQCCTVIGWFFPSRSQSMHLSPQKNKKTDQFAPEKEPFSIFEVIFLHHFPEQAIKLPGMFFPSQGRGLQHP